MNIMTSVLVKMFTYYNKETARMTLAMRPIQRTAEEPLFVLGLESANTSIEQTPDSHKPTQQSFATEHGSPFSTQGDSVGVFVGFFVGISVGLFVGYSVGSYVKTGGLVDGWETETTYVGGGWSDAVGGD